MSLADKIKTKNGKKSADTKSKNYLTGKEIRKIVKENSKVTRALEKAKYRKAALEEFTTEMKSLIKWNEERIDS